MYVPASRFGRNRARRLRAAFQNLVDEPVTHGIRRRHEVVAVGVFLDLVDTLPGVLGQYFVESVTRVEHFPGMDFHVRRLALKAAQRLVDHHAGMGQAVALALGTPGEQHGAHAGRLAYADGADVRTYELHRVVDREP